jgi:hypothetical protein
MLEKQSRKKVLVTYGSVETLQVTPKWNNKNSVVAAATFKIKSSKWSVKDKRPQKR